MISITELRGIPAFHDLEPEPLGYLASTVEDIHLLPSEYFVHEGDERALFVVVEGRAELTKVVNGEERVIGSRKPGQFFGEVPMTLSTNFPASGRAMGATRILRLDAKVFYTLAAMAPSVPAFIASLARRYLDSLQQMASEQPTPDATLIGPRVDAAVRELAGFLTRNHVTFERVVPEPGAHPSAYPILELRDGTRRSSPSMREVAEAVGLAVEPTASEYDVVILGAGPAGLTAAVNAAAEGLSTLVLEGFAPGGQAGTSTRIENYTGFPFGISGDDLASRALTQAKRLGAEIVVTRIAECLDPGAVHTITLDDEDTLSAAVVIMATGVQWRTLPVEGVDRFLGNGVYYGAARSDAALAQGQDIIIIGGGNSAGQAAVFFSRHARSVTILVRGESLAASMSRYLIDQIEHTQDIHVETHSRITALYGETHLEAVGVTNTATGATVRRSLPVLFVMIGADAVTEWLPSSIARDSHGFILTGGDAAMPEGWAESRRPFDLETSIPGVFAIGDVRSGSVKRVAAGVGEGGMAIAFAHQYLALRANNR
ncbi:Thioredoxin reductase [Microbacterium esteraromaticum]|uniref:Thioredoxin reductase n=1 Tax=Microbacterium esteraromaticum TaxID=57043 RepID=A0A1R4JU47_9MICO|nr:FAD-dependent oxidoreductase [Microbacterium esteraromaticum]SJN35791.1 Thioredoxin reductase [Microbacterium esteraromaticum]